jgi:putative ABC transport system permease protein
MRPFKQIGAVTLMNVRSIPRRLGSSCVVVIGMAGVVGVLISVVAMAQGLSASLLQTGRADRAVVLRNGSNTEVSSNLSVEAVQTIMDAPGIAAGPGGAPAASAEHLVVVNLARREDGTRAGLTVRGVWPETAATVRPEVRIVDGRLFEPGLREVVVGRSAQTEFEGTNLGERIGLRDSRWAVVGVFDSGGDAHESGFMTDANTLLSAYQRTGANSVTALLESAAAFETFEGYLTTSPTLSVEVLRETDYYRRQSQAASRLLSVVTSVVPGIMTLGALFAALNAMYASVSTRAREIATLRAIGFGAGGVVASVLIEALLLALLGSLCGAAIAWLLFSGSTISIGGGVTTAIFELRMTPALLGVGIFLASAVGLLGGVFPALRAARLPVATALRTV